MYCSFHLGEKEQVRLLVLEDVFLFKTYELKHADEVGAFKMLHDLEMGFAIDVFL